MACIHLKIYSNSRQWRTFAGFPKQVDKNLWEYLENQFISSSVIVNRNGEGMGSRRKQHERCMSESGNMPGGGNLRKSVLCME